MAIMKGRDLLLFSSQFQSLDLALNKAITKANMVIAYNCFRIH